MVSAEWVKDEFSHGLDGSRDYDGAAESSARAESGTGSTPEIGRAIAVLHFIYEGAGAAAKTA